MAKHRRGARIARAAALCASLLLPACQEPMPEGSFLITPRPPQTQPATAPRGSKQDKAAATQPQVDVVPATMPAEHLVLEERTPLNDGDVIEVTFYKDDAYEGAYRLEAGDKVKVEVDNRPELTHEGTVLPDGTLTLPQAGAVAVGGRSATQVQAALLEIYSKQLKSPKVSVLVLQARSRLTDFFQQLQFSGAGSVREIRINEGVIDLLLIGPVQVSGKTMAEARAMVQARYAQRMPGLHATLSLRSRRDATYAVLGEVLRGGLYPRTGPLTLVQAIAQAGGLSDRAWTEQVLIVRRQKDERIWVRVVNLGKSFETATTRGWGIELAANDVVYVPRSPISDVNLFVEQYLRGVMPVQVGAAATYPIAGN